MSPLPLPRIQAEAGQLGEEIERTAERLEILLAAQAFDFDDAPEAMTWGDVPQSMEFCVHGLLTAAHEMLSEARDLLKKTKALTPEVLEEEWLDRRLPQTKAERR